MTQTKQQQTGEKKMTELKAKLEKAVNRGLITREEMEAKLKAEALKADATNAATQIERMKRLAK